MNRVLQYYKENVIKELTEKFGYTTVMQVPKIEKIVVNIDLKPNDKVEVIDGPLNSFVGTVLSVDSNAKKCRVNVEMFGRESEVELSFNQIKVSNN